MKCVKVKFTIPGEPTGKGRPRFSNVAGFNKAHTPEKTANYETLVKWMYHTECGDTKFADDAMLDARMMVYYSIPKSASKKKQAEMLAGKLRPTKKPDIDNVCKIVLDSLNGLAFRDDTQVVDCQVRKFYSDTPRVVVTIQDIVYPAGGSENG